MRLTATLPLIVGICLMATAAGCGDHPSASNQESPPATTHDTAQPPGTNPVHPPADSPPASGSTSPPHQPSQPSSPATPSGQTQGGTPAPGNEYAVGDTAERVVASPDSIAVLVNKQFMLPKTYKPNDLVYPDVLFTYKEKIEKRMMRKVAAEALEKLFAGAKKDGVYLAGVSAYRSHATQTSVFNSYVKKDGEEKAKTYSAVPGHSEHETGLAIDVAGSDGKCAIEDCFAGTKEANWLGKHAAEYGFILRYPKGKESITGYQYEPWHIRYVGIEISQVIADKGITLEEYYHAVPVTKPK
jgi:D-alanyl-D-alanine carboxypeptidase